MSRRVVTSKSAESLNVVSGEIVESGSSSISNDSRNMSRERISQNNSNRSSIEKVSPQTKLNDTLKIVENSNYNYDNSNKN